MSDHTPALYSYDGSRLVPTDYTRGPWDPGLQHGGPVGGALGLLVSDAISEADTSTPDRPSGPPMTMARLTVELLRPVPVAPLEAETRIDRIGRRAAVAKAWLRHDGRIVAQASSQWVRPIKQTVEQAADRDVELEREAVGEWPPPLPAEVNDPGANDGFDYPRPGFNCDAFELRSVVGDTETPGPGTMWVRMKVRLVDDRPLEPLHVLATAADLANAVGWEPSGRGEPMINPDLTLQVFRQPVDEWICLDAAARIGPDGIGMMETALWDTEGRIGRVLSTMVENTGATVAGVNLTG